MPFFVIPFPRDYLSGTCAPRASVHRIFCSDAFSREMPQETGTVRLRNDMSTTSKKAKAAAPAVKSPAAPIMARVLTACVATQPQATQQGDKMIMDLIRNEQARDEPGRQRTRPSAAEKRTTVPSPPAVILGRIPTHLSRKPPVGEGR